MDTKHADLDTRISLVDQKYLGICDALANGQKQIKDDAKRMQTEIQKHDGICDVLSSTQKQTESDIKKDAC